MSHTPGPWAAERVWKSWQSELYTPSPEEPDHYMKRPITAIRSLTTHKCVALASTLSQLKELAQCWIMQYMAVDMERGLVADLNVTPRSCTLASKWRKA